MSKKMLIGVGIIVTVCTLLGFAAGRVWGEVTAVEELATKHAAELHKVRKQASRWEGKALKLEIALNEHKKECIKSPLTEPQRRAVEQVVMSEAGNQSFDGQAAVAQTIRDRSNLWGKTVSEIISTPAQYAFDPKLEPTPSVKAAVIYIFDYNQSIYEEPVTHFHTLTVSPDWAKNKVCRGAIGAHIFYY